RRCPCVRAYGDWRFSPLGAVHVQPLDVRLHVMHVDDAASGDADGALVGELAPGLSVERGVVQDDLDLGRGVCHGGGCAVDHQSDHAGGGGVVGVAHECVRAPQSIEETVVDPDVHMPGLLGHGVGTCPFALLGHQGTEPLLVHLDALFTG